MSALSTAAQKLGEKMYADQAQEGAAAGAAGAGAGASASAAPEPELEDDVVDADFKEVKTKTDKLSALIRRAENSIRFDFLRPALWFQSFGHVDADLIPSETAMVFGTF